MHAVPTVTSDRLELISMTPELIEKLLGGDRKAVGARLRVALPEGWPDEDERGFLGYRLRQMTADPSTQEWLVRAIVRRAGPRVMIGHIGFHGPPDDRGRPELGYTVFPEHRRQGYALEAITALMEWAAETHGVTRFLASVGPTNTPSLELVRKLRFVQTGSQWDDEDGLELVFQLEAGPGRIP